MHYMLWSDNVNTEYKVQPFKKGPFGNWKIILVLSYVLDSPRYNNKYLVALVKIRY